MEIESKKDMRLVSRAIRERWNVDREKIVAALMEVIESRDPELMIDAANLLMKADVIDVKRDELELKTQTDDNNQRLRLLELAKSIPASDLARIASENGIAPLGQPKVE